jgi:hypothetical protein
MHYQRLQKTGELRGAEPERPHVGPATCTLDSCDRPYTAKGYCRIHYERWVRNGDPREHVEPNKGWTMKEGYRLLRRPDHPRANVNGFVPEHRLVMEELLGRYLEPSETVHHRNGERADNRPENLELWVSAHPVGQRVEDLVTFAREILDRYGNEVARLR